jgi:DNA polymerase-3 subunit delta
MKSLLPNVKKLADLPVVAIIGGDPFLRNVIQKQLREIALGESFAQMNFGHFLAGEKAMADILAACRDFPCFASRRVVLLQDLEKIKKKEGTELIPYLQDPQPTTLLILEGAKADGRLEWVKVLKKTSEWVEVPTGSTPDAIEWVRQCFSKWKGNYEEGVPEQMVEILGTSFGLLQQATDQLLLMTGPGKTVSQKGVEQLFVKVAEENIFEVLDALFQGDRVGLHRSLDRLLSSGEAPLKILALLYRHLSILLSLRDGRGGQTWSLFRMPPHARRQYQNQASRFGKQLHVGLLQPLVETDRGLKGSPLPKATILKNCVETIGGLLTKRGD